MKYLIAIDQSSYCSLWFLSSTSLCYFYNISFKFGKKIADLLLFKLDNIYIRRY